MRLDSKTDRAGFIGKSKAAQIEMTAPFNDLPYYLIIPTPFNYSTAFYYFPVGGAQGGKFLRRCGLNNDH